MANTAGIMSLVRSRNRGRKSGGMNVYIPDEPTPVAKPYLEFSNDGDFTLSVASPAWDGTLEYSVDRGETWNTWNGSELSGTSTQSIYLRGTGNSVIAGGNGAHKFTFTGKYCTGNIENLLDYQTVANGEHPVMTMNCYMGMFFGCTSLIQSPELPATTLVNNCYSGMFLNCTSLTQAPELPATELAQGCYMSMFDGCTSLTTVPELPATTLVKSCYYNMFHGCNSLEILPKLPAITLVDNGYRGMFQGCSSIKISETQTEECHYEYRIPEIGEGIDYPPYALYDMFTETGGTFTGTPTINTTYYITNQPV